MKTKKSKKPAGAVVKKPPRPRKPSTTRREAVGKLLLDVGKLIFAGVFLANILLGGTRDVIIAAGGLLVAFAFFFIGILLIPKEKENGDIDPPEKE